MKLYEVFIIYFLLSCIKSIAIEVITDPYRDIDYSDINVYDLNDTPCTRYYFE